MHRKNDEEFGAVDLGPVRARPSYHLPREERRHLAGLDFEESVVAFLLSRYRLTPASELSPGTDKSGEKRAALRTFCSHYNQFPLFLGSLKLAKTALSRLTLPRLFSEPASRPVMEAMDELASVRAAYEDVRPLGLLLSFPGLIEFRSPATGKTVSCGRCSSLLFRLSEDGADVTLSGHESQPPIMAWALDNTDRRLFVQSFASWIYQLDFVSQDIFQ